MATIAAPFSPDHVLHLLGNNRGEIERLGQAEVSLAGRTFRIQRQFLDDIAAQPQADRIAHLQAALLVLHSPADELVGVDNARRIFDTARHPKSFKRSTAEHVARLLRDHRIAARTRKGRRALGCFQQAVLVSAFTKKFPAWYTRTCTAPRTPRFRPRARRLAGVPGAARPRVLHRPSR